MMRVPHHHQAVGAWYNNETNASYVFYGIIGLAAYGGLTLLSKLFR